MLQLEIYTPEKAVFTGEVQAVQVPGTGGLFEVLVGHAPLISSLEAGNLRVTAADGAQTSYQIKKGFVEVLNNHIAVLVEGVEE